MLYLPIILIYYKFILFFPKRNNMDIPYVHEYFKFNLFEWYAKFVSNNIKKYKILIFKSLYYGNTIIIEVMMKIKNKSMNTNKFFRFLVSTYHVVHELWFSIPHLKMHGNIINIILLILFLDFQN